MEHRQIKELMQMMGRTGMHRVEIKKGDFELKLVHGDNTPAPEPTAEFPMRNPMGTELALHRTTASVVHPEDQEKGASAAPQSSDEDNGDYITSPMVGTFYTTPAPDDPNFVNAGDRVQEGTVVCIIEAMKVMNEVKAGIAGEVVEVLVDNGHPVEFGTKLFRIKAS